MSVRYVDATRAGVLLARLTSRLAFAGEVVPLRFRLFDVRDASGDLVRLTLAYRDAALFLRTVVESGEFRSALLGSGESIHLRSYLQKSVMAEGDYARTTLWRALFLVHVAAWVAAREGTSEPILVMSRRVWQDAVDEYARRAGVFVLHSARTIGWWANTILSLLRLNKESLRALRLITGERGLGGGLNLLLRGAAVLAPVPGSDKPGLAVEYYGQMNLDSPEFYSDLFFWQQSDLRADDVLIVHNILLDPVTQERLAEVTEHGMSLVALHPSVGRAEVPVFHHWPGGLRSRHTPPGAVGRSIEVRWASSKRSSYLDERDRWSDLFLQTGARVWVSWYKYGTQHLVIADALASLGGATALYQRSFEDMPSPESMVSCDVYFGYSGRQALVEAQQESCIPYYVVTGYLGDHRFRLLKGQAADIRDRLAAAGAQRVIAFFDENSADDERWHTGHGPVRENYASLLERVLSDNALGLILKPKVHWSLRKRLGDVAELLSRAEATGRCVVLGKGKVQSSYPPSLAALAADVAIHGHACAATAGVEAALAGVPTLLLDREGFHMSSFYSLGRRVVFEDWNSLWEAMDEHWSTPGGLPGLGDWSPMLDDLDPFRDGRAAERMGTYLDWLLDGLKAGGSRTDVLADAAERYVSMWGEQHVIEVKPASLVSVSATEEGGAQ